MTGLLDTVPSALESRLSPAAPGVELAATPMLATLSDRRDFPDGWIFERKLDGIRVLAVREGGTVTLRSRSGRKLDATYPEIVDALSAQDCADFTIDGEIVAYAHGRTDFGRLQQRMGLSRPADVARSKVAVTYYAFDLLRLDGTDLRRLPLRTRKSLLRNALTFRAPLRLTTHRNAGGPELLADACKRGWEGLIAKRADSMYQARRSDDWLKLKCAQGQEFVVGGFTEPAGSRKGIGALLIGYYEDGRLRYAGKVGTGFDQKTLTALRGRLDELKADTSPFEGRPAPPAAHWTRPHLVAQIAFSEWTRDGMLRHPRYQGLRDDKKPTDVIKERART
ncbi:ATP-dependent DNA ligase [Streptomyces sp. YC504]|uniref:DNA ligase (ATP) n=1 Tax=Streptomyces mesophilus TaxID=1775132 RepID=A0A6G4XBQ4_9ACTN|nr:non-homologous end-joining DNA ligase [Streptomyces mesophilus]NGO74673.1 ATP-dependent DNA ligase [Streptomyces mesophilus]